jgi:AdoMet-dependent heme synthase
MESCLFECNKEIRVTWEITNRCNFNCKHCCNNSDDDKNIELSLDKVKETLDGMAEKGVASIYFSGGEPLIRKDMLEIIEYAKQRGIKNIKLATNGSLITSEIAEKLAKLKLTGVLVSLDGHTPLIHNSFRLNDKAYESSINAIRILSQAGVQVRVGVVIFKNNVSHLEEIVKIAIENGAQAVFFNWLMKTGRSKDNNDISIETSKYFEVANEIKRLKKVYEDKIDVGFHRFNIINKESSSCSGCEKLFHISSNGKISPCSWLSKICKEFTSESTLFDSNFKEVLSDKKLNLFLSKREIRDRDFGPGCSAICHLENGKMMSPDPLYG